MFCHIRPIAKHTLLFVFKREKECGVRWIGSQKGSGRKCEREKIMVQIFYMKKLLNIFLKGCYNNFFFCLTKIRQGIWGRGIDNAKSSFRIKR